MGVSPPPPLVVVVSPAPTPSARCAMGLSSPQKCCLASTHSASIVWNAARTTPRRSHARLASPTVSWDLLVLPASWQTMGCVGLQTTRLRQPIVLAASLASPVLLQGALTAPTFSVLTVLWPTSLCTA